jgi:hypothetical protein
MKYGIRCLDKLHPEHRLIKGRRFRLLREYRKNEPALPLKATPLLMSPLADIRECRRSLTFLSSPAISTTCTCACSLPSLPCPAAKALDIVGD